MSSWRDILVSFERVPATWFVWHVFPTQFDVSRQTLTCLGVCKSGSSRSNVFIKTFPAKPRSPVMQRSQILSPHPKSASLIAAATNQIGSPACKWRNLPGNSLGFSGKFLWNEVLRQEVSVKLCHDKAMCGFRARSVWSKVWGLELSQCKAKCEVYRARPASMQCGKKCEGLVGWIEREEEVPMALQR